MKELRTEFHGIGEVRDYQFTQIRVADKGFIYEVDYDGHIHYEVFKRVVNRRFACVSYPSSESFGKWAWTYASLERALGKFEELNRSL